MSRSRDRLERISSGFMQARILITSLELDLFTALGRDVLGVEEIAKRTGCKRGPLERLLNALVALRLLRKHKGRYSNGRDALHHLTEDAPEPLGYIIRHRGSMWETWSQLTRVVRTGRAPHKRRTPEGEKKFIKGMADIGVFSAEETVEALQPELKTAKRLLDLGGGPAVYACTFARCTPGLTVTVMDLPGPLRYARETIRSLRMEQQVKVKAADVVKASSLGRGYDIAFVSNLIHCFNRPTAAAILNKAARAVRSGGHVVVKDFYITRNGTAPPFAALFSINMLVADAGDCFSREEVRQWMIDAELKPTRSIKVARHSGILVARKD